MGVYCEVGSGSVTGYSLYTCPRVDEDFVYLDSHCVIR